MNKETMPEPPSMIGRQEETLTTLREAQSIAARVIGPLVREKPRSIAVTDSFFDKLDANMVEIHQQASMLLEQLRRVEQKFDGR